MRIVRKISLFIIASLSAVIYFAFFFIEARTLLSGDWKLMENVTSSFFEYLFRSIFFLSLLTYSIASIIFEIKNRKMPIYILIIVFGMALGLIFSFYLYDWYISLLLLDLTVGLLLFSFFKKEGNNNFLEKKNIKSDNSKALK